MQESGFCCGAEWYEKILLYGHLIIFAVGIHCSCCAFKLTIQGAILSKGASDRCKVFDTQKIFSRVFL